MELLIRYLKKRVGQGSPVISEIPRIRCFEGDKQFLQREDGSIDESPFQEIRSEMKFNTKELEGIDIGSLLKKLEQSAEDMSRGQAEMAYKHINDVVEEVGNVVDGKGQPFSADLIIEMMEKVLMDFDDNGKPIFPTLVVHPETAKKIDFDKVSKELESNPKYKELIDKKREQWRDREASRCLVG